MCKECSFRRAATKFQAACQAWLIVVQAHGAFEQRTFYEGQIFDRSKPYVSAQLNQR